MSFRACLVSLFALQVTTALANTEKIIFIAPAAVDLPDVGPSLEHLRLDTVSYQQSALRTAVAVDFPTEDHPRGLDSWYLLHGLHEGQRHEVRVCWAAVQPTEFWLNVYNITHVFDTPELIQSLSIFAEKQIEAAHGNPPTQNPPSGSLLFLQVQAAADYFTTNKTLMQHPPLVNVDIILDPYLASLFPASLVPTAIYIALLAILAYLISGWVWSFLQPQSTPKAHAD